MRCSVCQTKRRRKETCCPHCGAEMPPPLPREKRKTILPGFRSGKLYKKILACFLYFFILVVPISIYLGRPTGADETPQTIFLFYLSASVHYFFLVLLPFVLCSNLLGIRNRLPLFKERKRSKTILATTLLCMLCMLWLMIYPALAQTLSDAQFQALSPEKQAAIRLAQEKRHQEEALLAATKAEEKDLKKEQKQEEAARQKEEKEAAEKEKAKSKEEAKRKKDEQKEARRQAVILAKESAKQEEEAKKKQKEWEEACRKVDAAYQKRKTGELKALVQNGSPEIYAYLIEKCKEDYRKLVSMYQADLNSSNYTRLREFHSSIQDLRLGFPELQYIDQVSQKASAILERKEASEKLYSGSIKSESSLIYLDVYVDYRIGNSNFVEIAGYAVTDQYLDEYKICSYEYGYWGERPTSDWEAVLASSSSIQRGILQSWAISTQTKSYTDGLGFKKSYMVYRLVSQQEVDAFYAAMEQQEEAQRQLKNLWTAFQKILATS